ncbi:hypothetical protein INS49_007691 [Diaporthe citri]|uniref:uncharacterized protein n=1 Tax=Diaporthe citri TaxID=83186 RepID=UPI001C81803C|nr:uncharacterized protein INS49_007691 [Diaporthe citri]KAG6362599.1 hypothetical protein INS49_007691 [Diaporthe citri]
MPGSKSTQTALLKARTLSFTPTYPARSQKKANSRTSANFMYDSSIIIAHGLKRFENIDTAFDQLVEAIFEPSDLEKRRLFGVPYVYPFDIVKLIKDGDGRFHKTYTRFRKHVKQALTDISRKSTSPLSQPPRIIFLAHGIASWLVKRLLAEADGRSPVPEDDKLLDIRQVEGVIFLQDFPHSQSLDVSYSNYIEQWVDTLSKVSVLGDDWLANRDAVEDEGMGDRETDGKRRLFGLKQRLRWIDDRFRGLSANQHLSGHTWVLDPHHPVIDMRQTSNLPRSHPVNNEKHAGAVNTLLRRHRNNTTTTRAVTVNADVSRINTFIQIASPTTDRTAQSDQRSAVASLVLVSKEMNELESHLYFPKSQGKLNNPRNRPQATHHRSSSAPQGAVTGFLFPEYITREAGKSFQRLRPYSFPTSRPVVTRSSNDEEKWRVIFHRARKYLIQGDLDNADVLCKWCVDAGDQFFERTDIPLQWRMQRAVIQILRGQYRDAYTQLRNILMICFGLLEGPSAVTKAWRIPDKAGDTGYLPQAPGFSRRPSEVSGVDTSRSQDLETEQDILRNLFILSLELSYNIAVALTQMGKFQEAEDRLTELRNFLVGTAFFPVQEMALEEMRQLKLLVEVNRGLTLLKGYRGSFSEAVSLIAEEDGRERGVQEVEETKYRSQSLKTLTHAKILLSRGMVQDALQLISKDLPEIEKHLGRFHLTSLETRCLKALLLTRASRALEAETLCSETSDLIKRHLGEHHPLVLDIIHVLVSVCEIQARPLQALRISENLCTRAEETLGATDQRTIRFQAQHAWINVWIGNYEKGELLLQETYNAAESLWGPTHPWTLEYIPKLAFAYSLRGKTSLAKEYFANALMNQMVAFGIAKEDAVSNKSLQYLVREVLSAADSIAMDASSPRS